MKPKTGLRTQSVFIALILFLSLITSDIAPVFAKTSIVKTAKPNLSTDGAPSLVYLGNLGTVASKSSATELQITTEQIISAGNDIFVDLGHLRVTVSPSGVKVDYIDMIDGTVTATYNVSAGEEPEHLLGDVNQDLHANSTDALIVLSGDAGLNIKTFCPINCGDVNKDGLVNSTDALIILSFDVGLPLSFPVGQPGCPLTVTQLTGCTP